MSQLILTWLNDQLQLSKRVNNFQQDFSNGYLLGQLLSKYNQQLNFPEFLNKEDKKSKLKNFELLFDTFSALKVTFTSSIANQVINKKSGVAKKLLYQLKMNLQKTLSPGTNQFTKMTKMTKTLSPLKKIKLSKEQYDKVDKQHFLKQLNELHPAQKSINQQKLLKKFSDFHQNQISNNNQLLQKDIDTKLSEQRKFRDRQRDNLKKTADFRNQWERSNGQKWQANMTVRHRQTQKDMMFRTKLQQTQVQNRTMSELNAIKSLDKDINEFERKFIKGNKRKISQIDDSDQSDQYEGTRNLSQVQQPEMKKKQSKLQTKLKFPSATNPQFHMDSPIKAKSPTIATEQQKHQRQKKRRKMIVQQNKRYQLIQISRREKYILSTIQQTSKQQKQLQYEIWRVWQNKDIIKEDKLMQQQKERQKNETKQINAKFKRQQLLKTYRQQHETEVQDAIRRQQKLTKDHNVSERKKTYNQCKKMVQQFLQVSEKLFLNQQQKNTEEISSQLFQHLCSQFVENATTVEDVVELEVGNYVHGRGEWNLPVKRKSEDQPTDPSVDNAMPENVTNNYYLGNVLRLLYENKFSNKQNGRQNQKSVEGNQQNTQTPSTPCVISLLGPQFSGKHLAAQHIEKSLNFNIIQIQQLITRKLQQYQQLKDRVSEISQNTQKLANLAYAGKDIPNELIIQLVKEEVSRHQRNLLVNFPLSYTQALQLAKQLRNVQPDDSIPKSQLQTKTESFSRLVWPTESKVIPKPIRECGVDLALWIDVNDRTSYDRFLGRRWVQDRVVSVNDDVADLVGLLQVGDKASPQIVKNYQKLMEKQKLEEFFNQFGIQVVTSQQLTKISQEKKQTQQFRQQEVNQLTSKQTTTITQTLKAWSSIDGHCPIQQLQSRVLSKVQEAIKMKTMKRQSQQKKLDQQKKQQLIKEQLQKVQTEIKQKCVFTQQSLILTKCQTAINSTSLPQQFITHITSIWQSTQTSTLKSLKQSFQFLSSQSTSQLQYISQTKRNFINLLTREDKKFSIVKKFQIQYNHFLDQNKEMLSHQYTKDQLHQRVDDLEEELFQIIEQKKIDAIQEKKATLESGWIQSQMEQFYNTLRIMLQAELNRYNASQKILADFYSKKHAVPQLPYEENNQEITYDTTLQMITKDGACPRLEKLISQTLRLFNREEQVIEDKGKKGGKAPPAVKKDDKKGGKKNQPEEVKQPSIQEKQMKRAINIQKSIFRYRVAILTEFSQQRLLSMSKKNQQLYKQLQSYYHYTYETQNKTVFNLSKLFREKIQQQQKIQNQFEVQYVDVIENQQIRNFQKQKVIVLPAKEKRHQNRLTVADVREVITFINNEAENNQNISTKRLYQLLKHLKQNNQTEKETLPNNWKLLTQTHIEHFITKLDHLNLGFVQLWKVIIFIILSNCTVLNQQELETYYNQLTAYGTQTHLTREKFLNTKAWFDEPYSEVQNVRTFQRNQLIKDVLFEVLKQEQQGRQWINADRLVKCLGLKQWFEDKQVQQGKTYFDVAFNL